MLLCSHYNFGPQLFCKPFCRFGSLKLLTKMETLVEQHNQLVQEIQSANERLAEVKQIAQVSS